MPGRRKMQHDKRITAYECLESPCDPAHAERHKLSGNECLRSEILRFVKYLCGDLSYKVGVGLLRGFETGGAGSPDSLFTITKQAIAIGWTADVIVAVNHHGMAESDWSNYHFWVGMELYAPNEKEPIQIGLACHHGGYRFPVESQESPSNLNGSADRQGEVDSEDIPHPLSVNDVIFVPHYLPSQGIARIGRHHILLATRSGPVVFEDASHLLDVVKTIENQQQQLDQNKEIIMLRGAWYDRVHGADVVIHIELLRDKGCKETSIDTQRFMGALQDGYALDDGVIRHIELINSGDQFFHSDHFFPLSDDYYDKIREKLGWKS